jgi:hypothetical protein
LTLACGQDKGDGWQWQGRRDKQTEAMWQEEECSHLEPEAGREAGRDQPCKGTEAGRCRGRQAGAVTQECRQMSREGIR